MNETVEALAAAEETEKQMETEEQIAARGDVDDLEGFEWALVEIFGHRRHFGRALEVERFGAKMLRIDVPEVEWHQPADATAEPRVVRWVTHFYGGASIFSYTLTDERTVLRRNTPYCPPSHYSLPSPEDVDTSDGDYQDANY